MVYGGKPSGGCGTCRKRKVKCDETKPTCLKCQKARRQCLGYRDWSQMQLRSQTVINEKRYAVPSSFDSLDNAPSIHVLNPPKDQLALNHLWFCVQCLDESPKAPPTQGESQMRTWPSMFGSLPLSSALVDATYALAFTTFQVGPRGPHNLAQAHVAYAGALKHLAEAVQSPIHVKTNETLLATILMQSIEVYLVEPSDTNVPGLPHLEGAQALIRLRGSENLHDPFSEALYLHTRFLQLRQRLDHHISLGIPKGRVPTEATPKTWNSRARSETVNLSTPQDYLAAGEYLATILDDLRDTFVRPGAEVTALRIRELLRRCYIAEEAVVATASVDLRKSEGFEPKNSTKTPGESIDTYYGKRRDHYESSHFARTWNHYRVLKILVQCSIVSCLEYLLGCKSQYLNGDLVEDGSERINRSKQIFADLVDDICASVAFHRAILDENPFSMPSFRHRYVVWPLWTVLSLLEPADPRREWVQKQLSFFLAAMGFVGTNSVRGLYF